MPPAEFFRAANVSRETMSRLEAYAAALIKFQKTINLVSQDSLADLWRRHFLDSAQLLALLPAPKAGVSSSPAVLDIGSGAGFPGLVLAIVAAGAGRPIDLHLVEADTRKCAFLREAARAAGVVVTVHNCRIEDLQPFAVTVISARAVASVDKILSLIQRFTSYPGASPVVLLLKGRQAREELTAATKEWKMAAEIIPSRTEADAAILRLRDVSRG